MLLRQSRSMLYVHQRDEYQAVAPQRLALAASYSLPVISEKLTDPSPFTIGQHLLMSDYQHLAEFASMWLNRYDDHILQDVGRGLHQYLCVDHTFKRVIEANV